MSHRNSDCGTGTLTNSLIGAGYSAGYLYTHLGQMWQGPQGTSSTNSQYLCCDSSHPHQLTGLYSLGATCSTKTGQTYTSSYDAWGNVTSRNVNGTTATLSYDGLDNLTMYNAGSNSQEQYVYDASGNRILRRSTSSGTTMTVYAFGLEEHLYSGSGVLQSNGNTYYYSLGGMLVGESTGTNTNMFLTDALGSVLETISAAANTASVQGNQVYSPYGSSRYQQGTMGTAKGFTTGLLWLTVLRSGGGPLHLSRRAGRQHRRDGSLRLRGRQPRDLQRSQRAALCSASWRRRQRG